jgi:hypothetical protein
MVCLCVGVSIKVMQSLGLGKNNLIQSLPVETRILHRENSLREYKTATDRDLTGREIVLMVEWVDNGYWRNKSVVTQPFYEVGRLSNSPIFKKSSTEAVNFCTSKGKKMLIPNQLFGDIYEKYHNIDDRMLYLLLIRDNPFGCP